jgi:hypothetical protein
MRRLVVEGTAWPVKCAARPVHAPPHRGMRRLAGEMRRLAGACAAWSWNAPPGRCMRRLVVECAVWPVNAPSGRCMRRLVVECAVWPVKCAAARPPGALSTAAARTARPRRPSPDIGRHLLLNTASRNLARR